MIIADYRDIAEEYGTLDEFKRAARSYSRKGA